MNQYVQECCINLIFYKTITALLIRTLVVVAVLRHFVITENRRPPSLSRFGTGTGRVQS